MVYVRALLELLSFTKVIGNQHYFLLDPIMGRRLNKPQINIRTVLINTHYHSAKWNGLAENLERFDNFGHPLFLKQQI